MTIYELGDIIQKELVTRRCPNQKGRVIAFFEDTEIKAGDVLIGIYGVGFSPDEAISDYAEKIKEKVLVIDAPSTDILTREFGVPASLEGEPNG